jgi:hypothetical protein
MNRLVKFITIALSLMAFSTIAFGADHENAWGKILTVWTNPLNGDFGLTIVTTTTPAGKKTIIEKVLGVAAPIPTSIDNELTVIFPYNGGTNKNALATALMAKMLGLQVSLSFNIRGDSKDISTTTSTYAELAFRE